MRAILLALLALLPQSAWLSAQDAVPPFRTRAIAMARDALRTKNSMRVLKDLIAAAPKRLAGSAGAKAAADFALGEMQRMGLKNAHLEEVTVNAWDMGRLCQVTLITPEGELSLRALPLGGSEPTLTGGLEAEVVMVKTMAQLRALAGDARGKLVFFARAFDESQLSTGQAYGDAVQQRGQGAIEAAKAQGLGALVRSAGSTVDDYPHTGAMNYEEGTPRVPACALSPLAAERLEAALAKWPQLKVRWVQDCGSRGKAPAWNVIGDIQGSSKADEVVLLGGHIDAWPAGDGAHDDGAGCAHVLEAARIILASGAPPLRTIRIVLFANEENGLAGGRGYAAAHAAELHKHVAAFESDSGGFSPRGVSVAGGKETVDAMADLEQHLAALDLGGVRTGGGGADISPLAAFGVPLMSLHVAGERYFDLHHTAKDVLENVHPRELALGAAVTAMTGLWLADLETPLPRGKSASAK